MFCAVLVGYLILFVFFFFKQKTAYEMQRGLVGSEMCIRDRYMGFRLIFDYGDHDTNNPASDDNLNWSVRQDPFSTFRAGFDIRTYRLCKRVLMFHQFDELGTNTTKTEGKMLSLIHI
eukprot:TRINITY_DN47050_c0_g1_i1.p2 TRINITY_DN47050_c0_g1~~TRINITY_DN47050_c0_g1_i1.p2  ORF type:complete len:118 (+),score=24.80 TRINITY_DN47050_c0_g1_i1:68-421(+)